MIMILHKIRLQLTYLIDGKARKFFGKSPDKSKSESKNRRTYWLSLLEKT